MNIETVDKLISEATKQKKTEDLAILRLIKNAFLIAEKSGKPYDDLKILQKMVTIREESAKVYRENGRPDLCEGEEKEIKFISQFLPAKIDDETIREYTKEVIGDRKVSMKDMKEILGKVQEKYPGASGKIVSEEVRKCL